MTKEEILQKTEDKTVTQKDLLDYYKIKNIESLEFALQETFKEITQTGDFLNAAFKYIYNSRLSKDYNPIEEKYFFYAMVAQGFYNFPAEEIRIIASVIGAFQTVILLERLLENKEEVLFFTKMYKQYVEKIESPYLKLNEILDSVNKALADFSPEKLQKFSEDLKGALEKLQTE
jgi:ERCC4-related helicase